MFSFRRKRATEVDPNSVNREICTALGLDPQTVSLLTIQLRPGEPPLVTLTKVGDVSNGSPLIRTLSTMRLIKRED